MQRIMLRRAVRCALFSAIATALAACGGGGGSEPMSTPAQSQAAMPLVLSDASSDDWATIGVKVLSIALVPQGGGANVTVWTAPSPAPFVNLEQLDQLGEILGNVMVPTGTYSGAVLTVSANAGDVLLTVSSNPESGFPLSAGTSVPASQIQIQGTQGSSGALTVPISLTFDTPLTVTAGQSNALDLEFDLQSPAFIMGHTPPVAGGATLWAVNFHGPVRRRSVADIARLVLRHTYGSVTGVSSDNSAITITKDFAVMPLTNPETAVAGGVTLNILADATNGTLFYDMDAKTHTVIKDFSTVAGGLNGRYVRIAARYQENGTLVAVRIWASSQFSNVWLSPEGHVMHVDAATDVITVASESGAEVPVTVDANTEFFFRTPADALADATPIGTGPGFLSAENLVRGFKVHVSVVDPLATPLVAQTIDIETAAYAGRISNANMTAFTYTRNFVRATDDYAVTRDYLSANTPNGSDASGNPILGFKWWDFTFPTLAESGANAIPDFVSATNGGVNFGGSVGAVAAWGVSAATWADAANPNGWSLRDTVLLPTPLPLGLVTTAYANNSFAMSVLGGSMPATVAVSTTSGSATLVYQIDRSNGVVTLSPIDLTTSSGLAAIAQGLVQGAAVKVFGVPQANGTLKAYVLAYYTGVLPAS
jgi:hypothetical protein